jgi:hypothetical protein
MREITYVCSNCEAVDHVKLSSNEAVPPAINCWNCHAGFRMEMQAMLTQHRGMFPQIEAASA